MNTRMKYALALVLLTSACVNTTMQGGATEREICYQWGSSLPTRSRADTKQTQDEIQLAYAKFDLVCGG